MKFDKKFYQEAGKDGMGIALGIGGGIAANELNTWVEKQPWASSFSKFTPEITGAAFTLGAIFLKKGNPLKDILIGAAIVSGTEGATALIHKGIGLITGEDNQIISGAGDMVLGEGDQLGFVPKMVPNKIAKHVYVKNGIPVR